MKVCLETFVARFMPVLSVTDTCSPLKGTLALKNKPFKMNIYVKKGSVSVTKLMMASFKEDS